MSDPMTPSSRLLSIPDAASYLAISKKTVQRLIAKGELSIVKLPVSAQRRTSRRKDTNRRVLLDRNELDALIAASREKRI
jgi:excisionase family DNA binding protein